MAWMRIKDERAHQRQCGLTWLVGMRCRYQMTKRVGASGTPTEFVAAHQNQNRNLKVPSCTVRYRTLPCSGAWAPHHSILHSTSYSVLFDAARPILSLVWSRTQVADVRRGGV